MGSKGARPVSDRDGVFESACCVSIGGMIEIPIAERHLLFSEKGESMRKSLVIRIFTPRLVDPASVSFEVAEGTAVCTVEFDGISDETLGDTYGADSLQALQLAVDVEPVLRRLSEHYDFYFLTGEGYFDE
jgi:hypothetical protein